jgi:hypothetical protein
LDKLFGLSRLGEDARHRRFEHDAKCFGFAFLAIPRQTVGTLNGIGLAHYIRKRWPRVKLIVVSGKREIGSDELPAGARFFHKPYRETSIVEAMIGMLSGVS